MRKDQILQIAISKRLSKDMIGDNSKSSFSVVHQCICSVNNLKMTEEEKKQELIKKLQNFWRGGSKYITNCKREQICSIVKHAFGISDMQNSVLNTDISEFSFSELFLYYCYVERIAESDQGFSQFLWKDYSKKSLKAFAQKRAEEQKEKENKASAESKKLKEMSTKERWEHEIFVKQQDIEYFQKITNDNTFSEEEKRMIADILMKYGIQTGKWDGGKINKKQVNRIQQTKNILGI